MRFKVRQDAFQITQSSPVSFSGHAPANWEQICRPGDIFPLQG